MECPETLTSRHEVAIPGFSSWQLSLPAQHPHMRLPTSCHGRRRDSQGPFFLKDLCALLMDGGRRDISFGGVTTGKVNVLFQVLISNSHEAHGGNKNLNEKVEEKVYCT